VGTSARHWSLFVTTDASIQQTTKGTVYQVVDDRFAPANFKPEMRKDIAVMSAGRYQGSAMLGQMNGKFMESHYTQYAAAVVELIADHNKEPKNVLKLSNCQHWASDMVEVLISDEVIPLSARAAIASAPK
jgi:hypothetical protein